MASEGLATRDMLPADLAGPGLHALLIRTSQSSQPHSRNCPNLNGINKNFYNKQSSPQAAYRLTAADAESATARGGGRAVLPGQECQNDDDF